MPSTTPTDTPRRGRGRPRLTPSKDATRHTITLPADMAAAIRRFGGGKVSVGVRRLYDEFFGSIDDEEKP